MLNHAMSTRTSKGVRLSHSSAAIALAVCLAAAGSAKAQVLLPDGPQSQSQLQNQGNYGLGQTGLGNGTTSGQAQAGNSGQATSGNAQPAPTITAPGGEFSPTTISGGLPPANVEQTQVVSPTDGRSDGALYARPTGTPGQFELYKKPPPALNEFETFVQDQVGEPLQRFGSNLLLKQTRGFVVPTTTTVPPDYVLNPGDQIDIGLIGSAEATLRLVIDNDGKVFIPKVGPVNLAGVRYGNLKAVLERRISAQYRRVNVSVTISRLHGITVYVTGFATTPGAYTMSSLSTMIDGVLSAGGPSAGGSYRTVELRRGGRLVSTLDLYRLLFAGDKSDDTVLQNGDVLNILPTGPELAIVGSVNNPAIFEAKPGETLNDIITFAGGFNGLADTSRVIVRSLSDLDSGGSREFNADSLTATAAQRGDIVRVLSLGKVARPREQQFVLATIEGEVAKPGRYYMAPGSTLADLLEKAGGMTHGAFTYGTVVERDSIRKEAQAGFDQAIQNLELTAAAKPVQPSVASGGTEGALARSEAALKLIQRLKQQRPEGRLVLGIQPDSALPLETALQNNDRIYIPPVPTTVGVFGASYKTGSFLFGPRKRIGDYLSMAGGPQRIADRGDVFVVRANGSVLSRREQHNLLRMEALPGDAIFVPVRSSSSFFDKLLAVGSALTGPLVTAGVLVSLTR